MKLIDYRKAYSMIPHLWIIEPLDMFGVARNVTRFLKRRMVESKTELTPCRQSLSTLDIKKSSENFYFTHTFQFMYSKTLYTAHM